MSKCLAKKRTGIVVKGYPRLSETFIAREILELENSGLNIEIYSLRRPTDLKVHQTHRQISAKVNYLPEFLYREAFRVFRSWWHVRKYPRYREVWGVWWQDFVRDFSTNRIRRLGQALVLAFELPKDIGHLYAHFLHTPASVTRYAALIRGIPWSVSAHAVDIWTTPPWEIAEKLQDCEWVVTCTKANEAYLRKFTNMPRKVNLVYHGCDLQTFVPAVKASVPNPSIRLLSVGRAVEKKGYEDLLAALQLLPKHLDWSFEHIGGGNQQQKLEYLANFHGISSRCKWRGTCDQQEVIEAYQNSDVFVLACRIANNNDRDGLPNVLMEAQSQGLPCVSTRISAIPECIQDGVTGLLAEPGDVPALSKCLLRLIESSELRRKIGHAGQKSVKKDYDFNKCIQPLLQLFGLSKTSSVDKIA